MAQINIYTRKQFYVNKWGEKEYLDGSDQDDTLIKAALLTGKGLDSEEYLIYSAFGPSKEDAEKSLGAYIEANPSHPRIERKEYL